MKKSTSSIILMTIALMAACAFESERRVVSETVEPAKQNILPKKILEPSGKNISERFPTPEHYKRIVAPTSSFGYYLRNLPLKPHGSLVKYFNGASKSPEAYLAVVDLSIGNKDLHQCADAVIRLRAEYFWKQNRFSEIHFNFTNGFVADYSRWRKGYRIWVNENKVSWYVPKMLQKNDSYKAFWKYLEKVFTYAGTLSLSKELTLVKNLNEMKIGDVFIQGGSPGHAVIVVDIAEHKTTKEKIFMLAQSYMPAQEIQILKNPNDEVLSPWYKIDCSYDVHTPEWSFSYDDLKRFEDE